MTKEQLNKLINASVRYNAYTGTWSIDIDSIYKQYCDDLNAFVKKFVDFQPIIEHYEQRVEQAKKEVAREILQNLKEYIAYETKPFIKWGSDNPQEEIPDACIDSDMLKNKIDEIAKEYVKIC